MHGTICVRDLERSVALFTEALGFVRVDDTGPGRIRLVLRRPLPQWSIAITLEEEPAGSELVPTMDSKGWFVLALLSSDLNADAALAAAHRPRAVTEPFDLSVNGKPWRIVLCVLNSGFVVELMQQQKATGTSGVRRFGAQET
jgi:hypothetical protein